MIAGVVLPVLFVSAFAVVCHERIGMLLLKHPVETTLECLLALSIPYGNLVVWSALCRKDFQICTA